MSIARGRDLLHWLASNPETLRAIDDAGSRESKRALVLEAGFGDVSAEDVLGAIGAEMVLDGEQQGLDPVLVRRFRLSTLCADGMPPCFPPIPIG
jgi:hypothetical protein